MKGNYLLNNPLRFGFPLWFHAFGSIELDNRGYEAITGHQVRGHNVHGRLGGLLLHPPQQPRQTPPYDFD